jgi:phosphohistidine phosphatase
MTILTVMRHAKSSWDAPGLADFDRPLNDRGRKAGQRMGRELKHRRIRFDQLLASPATRVRETLDALADGYGEPFEVRFDPEIYGADVRTLFRFVRQIPESVHAPLLIGHNPGLRQLILELARTDDKLRESVEEKFPTAAVALIELPAVRWDEVEPGTGTIRELILPRDLD